MGFPKCQAFESFGQKSLLLAITISQKHQKTLNTLLDAKDSKNIDYVKSQITKVQGSK